MTEHLGHNQLSDEEIQELWDSGMFVFDTNVLIDLYRLPASTSDELLDTLQKLSEREQLWIPHQAALEYDKICVEIVGKLLGIYENLENSINSLEQKLNVIDTKITQNNFVRVKEHFQNIRQGIQSKLLDTIAIPSQEIMTKIDSLKKAQKGQLDLISQRISEILDGCVGQPYSSNRLLEIFEEGRRRYELRLPPGYQDKYRNKKGEPDCYGDLVIWFQIIDFAQKVKRPIIFVTSETKEDWWHTVSSQIAYPRSELIGEMREKADVQFHMYRRVEFLEEARKKFTDIAITDQTIDDIVELEQFDQEQEDQQAYQHGLLYAINPAASLLASGYSSPAFDLIPQRSAAMDLLISPNLDMATKSSLANALAPLFSTTWQRDIPSAREWATLLQLVDKSDSFDDNVDPPDIETDDDSSEED